MPTNSTPPAALEPGGPMSERLAEGLAALAAAGVRVSAEALARLPAPYRDAIQRSVDNDQGALTVQVDLPSGAVRVLIDGEGWVAPQVLLAAEVPGHGAG
jgi:hypothetical protein